MQFASRKKNSERAQQTDSAYVGVSLDEEDLVANIDEESEGEGKKQIQLINGLD